MTHPEDRTKLASDIMLETPSLEGCAGLRGNRGRSKQTAIPGGQGPWGQTLLVWLLRVLGVLVGQESVKD